MNDEVGLLNPDLDLGIGKNITVPYVICPKHGEHYHTITSSIKGHEGVWCMVCALDLLGPPLPTEQRPMNWNEHEPSKTKETT